MQPMPTAFVYFTLGYELGCVVPVATASATAKDSCAAITGELRPVETYWPEQPPL